MAKTMMAHKNHGGENTAWRSRLKLLFIFSLFVGPLAAAFLWYYGLGAAWLPSGKSNHAPLISPVVTLAPFENNLHNNLRDNLHARARVITLESMKHKWSIVHVVAAQCAAACQKSLYNTRQARLALGKDANRVQRYVVIHNAAAADEIQRRHADAALVKQSGQGLHKQLQRIIEQHNIGNHDALLVDPAGNVMMAIPVDLAPGLLLKDLKKLLKVSRIG